VVGLGSFDIGRWLVLLSPTSVLEGTNAFLFNVPQSSQFEGVILFVPNEAYFTAATVGIVGSLAVTIRRFQRVTA
jgi:hypothetical protein